MGFVSCCRHSNRMSPVGTVRHRANCASRTNSRLHRLRPSMQVNKEGELEGPVRVLPIAATPAIVLTIPALTSSHPASIESTRRDAGYLRGACPCLLLGRPARTLLPVATQAVNILQPVRRHNQRPLSQRVHVRILLPPRRYRFSFSDSNFGIIVSPF